MNNNKNILDLIPVAPADMQDIQPTVDLYRETKQILERSYVAIGRVAEYSVTSASAANTYNLQCNEHSTTSIYSQKKD